LGGHLTPDLFESSVFLVLENDLEELVSAVLCVFGDARLAGKYRGVRGWNTSEKFAEDWQLFGPSLDEAAKQNLFERPLFRKLLKGPGVVRGSVR
jgi:hypothetical protein